MKKLTTRNCSDAIRNREAFTTGGALWAAGGPAETLGELPEPWRSRCLEPYITYVVYSYRTPIAWRSDGEWVFPDVKYSNTTSHHQGQVRRAGVEVTR